MRIHEFIDKVAQLDEEIGSIDINMHHLDENENLVNLKLESSQYGEPGISGEEINNICETFGVGADAITVYASSENMYMDKENDTHALLVSVTPPVPEYDSGEGSTFYPAQKWLNLEDAGEED